jgi:hypothetical protein
MQEFSWPCSRRSVSGSDGTAAWSCPRPFAGNESMPSRVPPSSAPCACKAGTQSARAAAPGLFCWFLDLSLEEASFDAASSGKNRERIAKPQVALKLFDAVVREAVSAARMVTAGARRAGSAAAARVERAVAPRPGLIAVAPTLQSAANLA